VIHHYNTVYHADNSYELPVRQAVYQLLVLPESNGQQQLLDFKVESSSPNEWWTATNAFGAQCIMLAPQFPVDNIQFEIKSSVNVESINPFDRPFILPQAQWELVSSHEFKVENATFLSQTDLTHFPDRDMSHLPERDETKPVLDYLVALKSFLAREISYVQGATDAHTPADMAWQVKKGVCQDFAHVLIGWCRMIGIPARYVSGYLSQGQNFRGDAQLHAWAECLLPGDGWVGIDASNDLLVDQHYIKIAHGRDYYDCSPMTGVLISGGKQVSLHRVSVDMHANQ